MIAVLMNKNAVGGWQINGMRYALDFLVMVLLLAAQGMERYRNTHYAVLWKSAIVYAINLNVLAFGIYYVSKVYGY